ncbi:cytochrome P450 3A27-like isoform X2 [Denticeps clupeoides]|uniref:Cytochrome P450 3A n=1 Tax=Denticeps clupeoides TaxID=299321 RepID=A0AAY4BXG2_9TELE|nr:cytochrome P450 3A27-like isoform X2 [Denticeps clupeoides]
MLPSFSVETWSLLALGFTLLMIYGIWPLNYFRNIGISGPTPWPFFGSFITVIRAGFHNFDIKCLQKYGRVWGVFEGRLPVLMVADPVMIKTIMVKEFYSAFTNRREMKMAGPMADMITAVEDEKWKRIRNGLTPIFTSGRIKEVFPIADQYAGRFVENLKKRDLKEPVQIKDIFGPFNMDVLTSTSFSVETDSINNPDDAFVSHMKKLMKFNILNPLFLIMILFPFLVPLFEKLGFSFFSKSVVEYFYSALQKIRDQHRDDTHRRVDFLQLMMQSQITQEQAQTNSDDQPVKGLTDHEMLSQSFIFILAGYETTSTTLMFLAYNLATNPDCLSKLVEEVDEIFPNNAPVTYENLMQMEYMDMVIGESMRVFPTAPRIERLCKKTMDITGITIPKGTLIGIPVYALHRDPQLWPSPETFRPERFSKENKESVDPYAYLPFGIGPRNCIGMRYALMIMKLVLVKLLQNFTLETCKETQIPLELDSMYRPTKPVTLKLVARSHVKKDK